MQNPSKETVEKVENYMIDPEKAIFEAIAELKESLDVVKKLLEGIDLENIESIKGDKPERGQDYMNEEDMNAIEQFIVDTINNKIK